jgi:hypothetical protein
MKNTLEKKLIKTDRLKPEVWLHDSMSYLSLFER